MHMHTCLYMCVPGHKCTYMHPDTQAQVQEQAHTHTQKTPRSFFLHPWLLPWTQLQPGQSLEQIG